jgi:GntR family transcriptional regulator
MSPQHSEQPRFGKRERLIDEIVSRIFSGLLGHGDQLPGEHQLAQEFGVSRGTVRGALTELQRRGLITTESGIGSFVTYDGVDLDDRHGWARALARSGLRIDTEVLSISRVSDAGMLARFGLHEVVAVHRRRRDADGRPVSLERALVPPLGSLAELHITGLRNDSLSASLAAAGLSASHGEQDIDLRPLTTPDAELLGRVPGEQFLHSIRTTLTAAEGLVEHVVSRLDPAHFRFHVAFGPRS